MCRACLSNVRGVLSHRHAPSPGQRMHDPEPDEGEAGESGKPLLTNPNPADTHAPMKNVGGNLGVNMHTVGHYGNDMDGTPIVFNRFGTRWGDMQLKNGLANGVASGRVWGYRGEGWYDVVVPVVPGQTRLIGGRMPGFYPAKGPSPGQWQDSQDGTVASQVDDTPGGPGHMMGQSLYNPGTGG